MNWDLHTFCIYKLCQDVELSMLNVLSVLPTAFDLQYTRVIVMSKDLHIILIYNIIIQWPELSFIVCEYTYIQLLGGHLLIHQSLVHHSIPDVYVNIMWECIQTFPTVLYCIHGCHDSQYN